MENKKKILYAEDNKSIRKMAKSFLPQIFTEYDFEFFEDGSSLKNRLEGDTQNVQAVFTDNEMPGVNGTDLIKKYALTEKFKQIPFILASGDDDSICREALFNGAFTYIQKPFSFISLKPCLEKAINILKNS